MYRHHLLRSNCLYIQKHLTEDICLLTQQHADHSYLSPVKLLVFRKYTIYLQNKMTKTTIYSIITTHIKAVAQTRNKISIAANGIFKHLK